MPASTRTWAEVSYPRRRDRPGPRRVARGEPEPAGTEPPEPPEPPVRGPAVGARPGGAQVASRYAGAMLLHAFLGRAEVGTVLGGASGRPGDVALLTAASLAFALGAASAEATKAPDPGAGRAAGRAGCAARAARTLRPRLAAIADGCDPLGVQASPTPSGPDSSSNLAFCSTKPQLKPPFLDRERAPSATPGVGRRH